MPCTVNIWAIRPFGWSHNFFGPVYSWAPWPHHEKNKCVCWAVHICNKPGWWTSSHLDNHSAWSKSLRWFCHSDGYQWAPKIRDYWSTNDHLHYLPVASHITQKRFIELSTYLHFTNNENIVAHGQLEYNWLAEVRPVSLLFGNHSLKHTTLTEMFKGRSSLKQYLSIKLIKRGFKVWIRADGHNGFLCNLDDYTGKEESFCWKQLGAKVVKSYRGHWWVRDTTCTSTIFFSLLEIFWKTGCTLVAPSAKTEGVFLRPSWKPH